ncbi:hypothetical protein HMPREF1370_02119 [Enterococcus faecium P1123]|nr:hypothetical protein HMPREF1376_02374 [Enterococcus faecium R446]EJX78731.1 hypothetical protein HMPREF1370_02119 [Enterococcus faecium P1123]EJY33205.1 hypothetical protein HMPREF1352_02538 [Enterococcus faecium 511]EJY34979.1 hypothetical protein HMPREF1350_03219 [Enterococcus faecium 509]
MVFQFICNFSRNTFSLMAMFLSQLQYSCNNTDFSIQQQLLKRYLQKD